MKRILSVLVVLFVAIQVNAQTPQFAVVRPDGTTYICPTWDSAYNKASNGDNIYLPGITIAGTISINKRLAVYGTGHYPDSTTVTGKSIFVGPINVSKKVYLEGFECQNAVNVTDTAGNSSSFIRIKVGALILNGTGGHYISQCVLPQINNNHPCNPIDNILITNSIITGGFYQLTNSVIQHCIFLGPTCCNWLYSSSANTMYRNNIFHGWISIDWYYSPACFSLVGNNSQNNIFTTGNSLGNDLGGNIINVNIDSIFVNQNGGSFYQNNYHLKPNSPYLNAASDGTQIGIYGGSTPYIEGAVPSNPHIYFKQVAEQTNSSGQLQIQFKVRTNN